MKFLNSLNTLLETPLTLNAFLDFEKDVWYDEFGSKHEQVLGSRSEGPVTRIFTI